MNTELSAHAHLTHGAYEDGDAYAQSVLKAHDVTLGNPDVYVLKKETVAVDDARQVTQFASLKPVGSHKHVVVIAHTIQPQAQHALLKILEEGSGHTRFYLHLAPGSFVLETILSRCVVTNTQTDTEHTDTAHAFLQMTYPERIKQAEAFSKNQDRDGARTLVRELLCLSRIKSFAPEVTRDLLHADQQLQNAGSSPKIIIGHLALVL